MMPEFRVAPEAVCDFCSDPHPVKTFEAEDDFLMASSTASLPEMHSKGGWMACQPCAAMIESERWEDLLDRAAKAMTAKHALPAALVKHEIKRSHNLFRAHRRRP
jgi:hypothetical protein